jgi:hypothetical protein
VNAESLAKQIELAWLALDDEPTPLYLREAIPGEWVLSTDSHAGAQLVKFFTRDISLPALRERVYSTLSRMRPG